VEEKRRGGIQHRSTWSGRLV